MRDDLWQALRRRFGCRCGYCGVAEADVGSELTVDHFHPRGRGGQHQPGNWVYCCHACNYFKGDYWEPEAVRRILHPLRDDLSLHVVVGEDGVLGALTETGLFHIQRLHLNRPALVAHRRQKRRPEQAHTSQSELLERIIRLEEGVETLMAVLRRLDPRSPLLGG